MPGIYSSFQIGNAVLTSGKKVTILAIREVRDKAQRPVQRYTLTDGKVETEVSEEELAGVLIHEGVIIRNGFKVTGKGAWEREGISISQISDKYFLDGQEIEAEHEIQNGFTLRKRDRTR